MKSTVRSAVWLTVVLLLALNLAGRTFAAGSETKLEQAVERNADYLLKTVTEPQFGSSGGEWVILGLARSGVSVAQAYWDKYYAAVEQYVKECGGVLHTRRYTEYSRAIVALSALGRDPSDIAGYDLLVPLGDYDATVKQGLNGAIWALIALDSGDYDMPTNNAAATQATRQMYVDLILSRQQVDGGWILGGSGRSDTDMTAMALQALSNYLDQTEVDHAIERGLTRLSELQNEDGGFSSYGVANAESCVQVIVALCELGVELTDQRFVKNGNTVLGKLLTYQNADGSFLYKADDTKSSLRASEHALYGLAAALRAVEGRSSLYQMDDVNIVEPGPQPTQPPKDSGGTQQKPELPPKGAVGEAAEVQASLQANSGRRCVGWTMVYYCLLWP